MCSSRPWSWSPRDLDACWQVNREKNLKALDIEEFACFAQCSSARTYTLQVKLIYPRYFLEEEVTD